MRSPRRPRFEPLLASLWALVGAAPACAASGDACWDASVAASRSDSWGEFREADERCAAWDGAYGELKAEGATRLLIQRWHELPELEAIAVRDPVLLEHILDVLGDLTPQDEAAAIYRLATEECPSGSQQLCERIAQRVAARPIGAEDRAMRTLKPGEVHEFDIDARALWNPSDCLLERGGHYRLEVIAVTEPWVDGWVASTPDGGWPWWGRVGDWLARGRSRAPDLPMYVVVGAVAQDPATFFAALAPDGWTAPQDGVLELFANDWEKRYFNNEGRLSLRLSRL